MRKRSDRVIFGFTLANSIQSNDSEAGSTISRDSVAYSQSRAASLEDEGSESDDDIPVTGAASDNLSSS